jgi:membrane fusion protein
LTNPEPTKYLFREEVLSVRRVTIAGNIVLARPLQMSIAATTSVLLTVALVCFLCFGEYVRKVRVTGQIMPAAGVLKIIAPQFGQIVAVHVAEGDAVRKGQLLYEVSSERTSDGAGLDARIEAALSARDSLSRQELALQTAQLEKQKRSYGSRVRLVEAELARIELEIDTQRARVERAAQLLKRYETLKAQGFISDMQFNEVVNAHQDQVARQHSLERGKLSSMGELEQLQLEALQTASQVQLSGTQASQARARLEQEDAEHRGRTRVQVLAPAAGAVAAAEVEIGQSVATGAHLANLLPAGSKLEAHLYAASSALGFVKKGQPVLLRVHAFPYQKFGQLSGTVTRVEQSPMSGAAPGSAEKGEPIYRIVVQLERQTMAAYGEELPFISGMTLEADILQDRRRLIEWVMDPIISLAKGRSN